MAKLRSALPWEGSDYWFCSDTRCFASAVPASARAVFVALKGIAGMDCDPVVKGEKRSGTALTALFDALCD